MKLLNPKEFDQIAKKENTIILDVRHQNDFVKGHIPGSIFIGSKWFICTLGWFFNKK